MGDHILASHMILRELRLGPAGPTELEMVAKAVSNGASVERVARRQRYQAARLAKFRLWIADGALCLIIEVAVREAVFYGLSWRRARENHDFELFIYSKLIKVEATSVPWS